MSRMYNTVGVTGAILSTGFNSKETTYLLFAHEQAYLPYLKKSLIKSTLVRRNAWEINTSLHGMEKCDMTCGSVRFHDMVCCGVV